MDNILVYVLIALVTFLVLAFGLRTYLKNKKVKQSLKTKSGLDITKLIGLLGDKENIKEVSSNGSKLSVVLNSTANVQVDSIKQLGASGIVQNQNKLIIIFGKMSQVIENEIREYIKK